MIRSFATLFIEAKDDLEEDLLLRLPVIFEFLKEAKRTLFHCRMGGLFIPESSIALLNHRWKGWIFIN